jgi:DNA-binding CsgD family transcriptional regulator/PAS domain-containing protein
MYSQEQLSPLIERVYEAMLNAEHWPRALTGIAHSLQGRLPVLYHHDTGTHSGGIFVQVGYEPGVIRAYNEYYSERNIWLRKGEILLRTERVRTSHMMCSRRELLRSEFFGDFLSRIDADQAIGATLLRNRSASSNITFFAARERADFARDDTVFLDALVPHLQRALQVSTRMAESKLRHRELQEMLAGLSVGVLLVTAHGKVLFMNPVAHSIIVKNAGLVIDATGLRALRPDDTSRLRALIGGAANTSARRGVQSGGSMGVARSNGDPPLEILVSPIHIEELWNVGERAVAAVYVTDPSQTPRTEEATLRRLYALTSREAKVFSLLARSVSAKQAAEILGVSYNTLKTHLRHIFTKTNTRNQLELARLANRGIANLTSIETK